MSASWTLLGVVGGGAKGVKLFTGGRGPHTAAALEPPLCTQGTLQLRRRIKHVFPDVSSEILTRHYNLLDVHERGQKCTDEAEDLTSLAGAQLERYIFGCRQTDSSSTGTRLSDWGSNRDADFPNKAIVFQYYNSVLTARQPEPNHVRLLVVTVSSDLRLNPFNASCSKILLFEGSSAILV